MLEVVVEKDAVKLFKLKLQDFELKIAPRWLLDLSYLMLKRDRDGHGGEVGEDEDE